MHEKLYISIDPIDCFEHDYNKNRIAIPSNFTMELSTRELFDSAPTCESRKLEDMGRRTTPLVLS